MSEFVATIHVRPKREVRDPQGESVAGALRSLGFDVADVRTGKEIVVRFEAADERAAAEAARTMGDQLLANPVIEDHATELSGGVTEARHADVRATVRAAGAPRDDEPVRITWLAHSPRSSTGVVQVRSLRPHIHREHDEILHVIGGRAEFLLGEEWIGADAGHVVIVPAGTVHTVRPASADCVLSTVFSPRFDPERPDREFVDEPLAGARR